MDNNKLLEFTIKARDIINEFDVTDEEKSQIFLTVEALLKNDADQIVDTLSPVDDETKLYVLRTATQIIDSLRMESEDEIIEAGDAVQLEKLGQLAEAEDKAFGEVFEKILAEYQQKYPPKVQASGTV